MEMDILVYKQNMPMYNGESIGDYTRKLDIASRTHMMSKLNIAKGSGGAWTTEIYNDKVIMCVYKGEESNRYYLVKYSRDKNGTFNFGDMIEVERVTSYKPKVDMQITKAVWSTAFINNLPDAAFAIILPGGKKDNEGKTTPRGLRKLPHHNANVKSPTENSSVDLTHLRNALARVSQTKMSPQQISRAQAHLNSHAKELLSNSAANSKKACGGGEKTRKALGEPIEFNGWMETEKSFWTGVI
jgi:hypothetical protein